MFLRAVQAAPGRTYLRLVYYREHPNLEREKAYEGKYVIQTEEANLSAVEAVTAYKELNEVERGFAHLKDLLEVRPVYHRWEQRVRAHAFVAALAFLLDRALEKKLRHAPNLLSSPLARRALETVRCVRVEWRRTLSCASAAAASTPLRCSRPWASPTWTRPNRCRKRRSSCSDQT